jgi:hypothetical protein
MLLGLSAVVAAVTVLPESLAIAQADELGRTPFVAGLLCAALPLGTVLGAALAGRPGAADDRLWLVRPLGLLACSASAACLLEPGWPAWSCSGSSPASVPAACCRPTSRSSCASIPLCAGVLCRSRRSCCRSRRASPSPAVACWPLPSDPPVPSAGRGSWGSSASG